MSLRVPSSTDQLIGTRIHERRMVGLNSISAGRLYEIARRLDTPVEYFFEGLERENTELPLRLRRLLDISRDVGEIENQKHQQAISQLTRALAGR
jgi:hypothetical protein